jgi:ATPase subunit of ABC transporter with duplicated ATPase domains
MSFMDFLSWDYLLHRLAAGEEALHRSASAMEAQAVPRMAQDTFQTLIDSLSAAGADAAQARARKILLGLGFKTQQTDAPTSRLSGKAGVLCAVIPCCIAWQSG